jgi:hypothetical protein
MDRPLIYPGAIPLETDLLNTSKSAYIGLSKLAAAMFGTGTFVNGLVCSQSAVPNMAVSVGAGEIYSLQNIDGTAYSSLAADTTHQILKQGVLLDAVALNCPAPLTAGQSINYLVQAAFSEVDAASAVLPYYNASNPSVAWSGAGNSGVAQATNRSNTVSVSVVAGTAATTGSQVTPTPSGSAVGLWVVTVAFGAASITNANISQYASAPFNATGGAISRALTSTLNKSVAGGANVTLDPVGEASAAIINLLGALTASISVIVPASADQWIVSNNTSGAFTTTVKTAAGTGIVVPQGTAKVLYCDGTNVQDAGSSAMSTATADTRYGSSFLAIGAAIAANALTATLNPCKLDFRSATLTTGVPNNRSVASALSLVVPSGATLGTIAATAARLALLAIDNAGTVELAVTNLAGGLNLDETTLISTTAISAASTAANVIYSTTARASVPFRVIGFIDITEATAGTWATAPTAVQGIGGQALAAMSSLGYGQTYQNVTASRAVATTYYNTTGRPIAVSVTSTITSLSVLQGVVNGVQVCSCRTNVGAGGEEVYVYFIVPAGASYSVTTVGSAVATWFEMR